MTRSGEMSRQPMTRQELRPQMQQTYELFWLAFLLTGNREVNIDAVAEALDVADSTNSFFGNWMSVWSRKLFIAKVLGPLNSEMAASAQRTEQRQFEDSKALKSLPHSDWSLAPDTDKLQLEHALLAIDLFPRCALLLIIFEKLSLDDAMVLLNADKELVATAKAIGLIELTRNLARAQGWASAPDSGQVKQISLPAPRLCSGNGKA
jgi:hypothetical protein